MTSFKVLSEIIKTHPELLLSISQNLDLRSFINLSMVSKATYRTLNENFSWKERCIRDLNIDTCDSENWRDNYKKLTRYVLLLVSSATCMHCPAAEEIWENIETSDFDSSPYTIQKEKITFPSFSFEPENLKRIIHFVPCWILMPIQEWDSQKFQIVKICGSSKEAFINKPEMHFTDGFLPLSNVRTKALLLKSVQFSIPEIQALQKSEQDS